MRRLKFALSPYRHYLEEDGNFRRWVESIERGAAATAANYFRKAASACEQLGTTPQEVARFDRKQGQFWAGRDSFHNRKFEGTGREMESKYSAEETFLETPASCRLIRKAMANARQVYGPDALAPSVLRGWLDKNPLIVGVLRSASGKYLGYFDVLPLSKKYAKLSKPVELVERNITTDAILPPEDMRRAGALYLASIVVKNAGSTEGRTNGRRLFYGLARYLEAYYMPGSYPVFAIAVSSDGKRVLKRFGARLISPAKERSDSHNLYRFLLTFNLINAIKERASAKTKPPTMNLDANDM